MYVFVSFVVLNMHIFAIKTLANFASCFVILHFNFIFHYADNGI